MTSSSIALIRANPDVREERMIKAAIARQMNRSGNTLLAALEPISDDDFYEVGASGISAAWTVGHIACVNDLFSSWFDGGKLLLDAATHKLFNSLEIGGDSTMSKGASVKREERSKKSLLLSLRKSQIKALDVLDSFDENRWEAPIPRGLPDTLMICGAVWEHLSVHTYWHLGELSSLMPRFYGTYTLNTLPHYFYSPRSRG